MTARTKKTVNYLAEHDKSLLTTDAESGPSAKGQGVVMGTALTTEVSVYRSVGEFINKAFTESHNSSPERVALRCAC